MKYITNFLKGFWLIALIYLVPYLLSIPLSKYTGILGIVEPGYESTLDDRYFWFPGMTAVIILFLIFVILVLYWIGEGITDAMNESKDNKDTKSNKPSGESS